jgi:DNA-binding transcriptional ArsR family regulator
MPRPVRELDAPCACSPKPPVEERPLLGLDEARRLEELFKLLANGTRLRLLHALARAGEVCPSELARTIGMKPQATWNQLQRLTERGILGSRREGHQVHYRIVDPCVIGLLDYGLCLSEEAAGRMT